MKVECKIRLKEGYNPKLYFVHCRHCGRNFATYNAYDKHRKISFTKLDKQVSHFNK